MHNPYEELIRQSKLSSRHQEELKKKRGFSDETIDTLRFRSADRKMIEQTIHKWLAEKTFSKKVLIDAGILQKRNDDQIVLMSFLTSNQILIPFLDESGEAYFLRSHKMYPKGFGLLPYCPFLLQISNGHTILAEGSLKAAAAWQLGFAAVGIDGISTFSGKRFPDLVEIFRSNGITRITVIFDNEVKDDPQFEKYKADPNKRYDADYWAIRMAEMLNDEGFEANVGRLPDEWRENGKADIDSALAQGHTSEEFQQILDSSLAPDQYLKSLHEEAQKVIAFKSKNRKLIGQIIGVRAQDGKGEFKWRQIGKLIIDHFQDEGAQFYIDGEMVIVCLSNQTFEIGSNLRFNALLYRIAELNPTTSEGRFIWAEIKNGAVNLGKKFGLAGWCYFDLKLKEIHLLLDGDKGTAVKIANHKVQSTLNGGPDVPVLLRAPDELVPIKCIQDVQTTDGIKAFWCLVVQNLTTEPSSQLLVSSFYLCFFLKDITKDRAILKMSGKTASGKSTAADLFAYLLLGTSGLEVSTLAARFSQAPILPFIILDNLENEDINRGSLHFLLTSATGITKKKRAAGTNTDVVREKCEALVVVTAIEPFAKPELVNRTLEVEFDKRYRDTKFMKSDVHLSIFEQRNTILSALFQMMAEKVIPAIADGRHRELKQHLDTEYPNHPKDRCNEFLSLMATIAEALTSYTEDPQSGEGLLSNWVKSQSKLSVEQEESSSDVLYYLEIHFKKHPDLIYGLSRPENAADFTFEASSRDLLESFTRLAKEIGTKCPFTNPGQLMSRINNDTEVLRQHGWTYEPKVKKINGTRIHRFTRSLSEEDFGLIEKDI
jgi:hypothetical protein